MTTSDTINRPSSLNDIHPRHDGDMVLLSQGMVHQVDHNQKTGNFLFRGNLPVDGTSFDYDKLLGILRNAANGTLPTAFKIVDICLLWQFIPKDFEPVEVEKKYWKENADKGWFVNNPIFGSLLPPPASSVERKLEEDVGGALLYDHLDDHVDYIKSLLDNSGDDAKGQNIVIYVHCDAGKDRTGEVIAAYEMKYMGKSYKDAFAESVQVAGRDLNQLNQNAMKWFAYHLQEDEHIPTIGSIG